MEIACLKDNDFRSPIIPKNIKKFIELGFKIGVEKNIGDNILISDEMFLEQGAQVDSKKALLKDADIILKVNKPLPDEIKHAKKNAIFISFLDPFLDPDILDDFIKHELSAISMNLIMRSSLAQKMDALSSQANLLGYASVIYASNHLNKILPMMSTPSGTIYPAKVFIIGAGVAGLQAIATAKRLGATVEAFDTRKEVEEQIKSLGAKFLKIDLGENLSEKSGYAKQLTNEQIEKQRLGIKKAIESADIVITTAQVFGRKAPVIITKEMLSSTAKQTIIVDLAIQTGGNVEGAKEDKIVNIGKAKILAPTDLINLVALDASNMYSTNLYNLVEHFYDKANQVINFENEILKSCLVVKNGQIVNPLLKQGK